MPEGTRHQPSEGRGPEADSERLTAADTEEMLRLGERLAAALVRAGCGALVLDLRGELGAGKTVFVRGLARALGLADDQRVVSPTFTIARSYALHGEGPLRWLHHIDAYRLRGADDLEAAGFDEMCGIGCLTCVEWGERVEGALPMDRLLLSLCTQRASGKGVVPQTEWPRSVTVAARGPGSAAVLAALRLLSGVEGRPA